MELTHYEVSFGEHLHAVSQKYGRLGTPSLECQMPSVISIVLGQRISGSYTLRTIEPGMVT